MRAVCRRFDTPAGSVTALDRVDIDVPSGQLTVIVGPSGSGKSTLLAIAACFDRADSGQVVVDGTDVQLLGLRQRRAFRQRSVGLVLPEPADNLLSEADATANLRWNAHLRCGLRLDDDEVRAKLALVSLEDAASKRVPQLSGGEQQRLALLCALVGNPQLILADEPTAALDREASERVIAAMRAAITSGATMMVATHDPHVLAAADLVIRVDHGRRVE
jgi:putative ABC transport system ATP-binding protein/macrolide transport system ATP-binding/permease protein